MKNKRHKYMTELDKRDVSALYSIYQHRCLTLDQIYRLHYRFKVSKENVKKKINKWMEKELVKKVLYKGGREAYFLMGKGVELLRYMYDFPANIYDHKNKAVRRGYYRAFELDMYPKLINHQIHLNEFVIQFQQLKPPIKWKYYDEKYVSQYSGIRPDGMLSLPDVDIFLEMDMATESKKQLHDKWDNYRQFLNSREYAYREKKIVMLFIVSGTTKLQQRIDLVKHTIYERLLDAIDKEFDIYVGTQDDLLSVLQKRFIQAYQHGDPYLQLTENLLEMQHEFYVSSGSVLNNTFDNVSFSLYIQKLSDERRLKIEHGKIQEFIVDDYFNENVSVISKATYIQQHNAFFKSDFKRNMNYLVVAKKEMQIYRDFRMNHITTQPFIYFTTYKRLKELPFHQALFQFDELGNLYHFKNNGLEERVFERNLEHYFQK